MVKRITVVRALEDVGRDVFVDGLVQNIGAGCELYVTQPDPRPAIAVVCSDVDAAFSAAGDVLVTCTVDEHVLWDEPIDGPVHSMFAFFRPAPGLEQGDFAARYREHAEVARVQHPGIKRYLQDLVTEQAGEDRWLCSAISELHFAGAEEYRDRFWRDESSREVVARDVARFSDAATAKALVVVRMA